MTDDEAIERLKDALAECREEVYQQTKIHLILKDGEVLHINVEKPPKKRGNIPVRNWKDNMY